MKYVLALVLTLLFACEETMVRPPEAKQISSFRRGLFYVRDDQSHVCFAVKTFTVQSSGILSSKVEAFTAVDCTPEVMALVLAHDQMVQQK